MYDMTSLITRFFTIKLPNGLALELEPPKLKVLRKISGLTKNISNNELTEADVEKLSEAISLSLSKNKQSKIVTIDEVEDMFDIDSMYDFLTNYFNWVSEIQNAKN